MGTVLRVRRPSSPLTVASVRAVATASVRARQEPKPGTLLSTAIRKHALGHAGRVRPS